MNKCSVKYEIEDKFKEKGLKGDLLDCKTLKQFDNAGGYMVKRLIERSKEQLIGRD